MKSVLHYQIDKALEPLPEGHDGTGSNIISIYPFSALKEHSELRELTQQQLIRLESMRFTTAELYGDTVLGTLAVPNQKGEEAGLHMATFYMRKDKILFFDDGEFTPARLDRVNQAFAWQRPDLPSFFCSFLDSLIEGDLRTLEAMEIQMNDMEDKLLTAVPQNFENHMARLRRRLSGYHRYYAQLSELADTLGESPLFDPAARASLDRFVNRCQRLNREVQMLREYAQQLGESYRAQLDVMQNKTMQMLTVVSTICMPLTLIAGWFGMNFVGMPELKWVYSYPVVIAFSVAVVAICFYYCKKKKLL